MPFPEGHTVFATGGHGFIGRRVVAALVAAGARVICPYRSDGEAVRDLPGEPIELDLVDAAATAGAVAGCDTVVHLAARAGGITFQEASQAELFLSNQAVTASVLAAAAAAGVRRVFLASSAVVYAPQPGPVPIGEDDPLVGPGDDPSGYAWSKVCDEVLGGWHRDDLEVVAGRFTNVYGPHDPGAGGGTVIHDLAARAVEAAPDGEFTVWGDGSAVRSFVYVDDAAAAVIRITASGAPGTAYNVDSGRAVTIAGVAGVVAAAAGPGVSLRFDPSRPSGEPFRVLDIARLRGLGWEPQVDLEEGVARVVAGLGG